MKTYREWALEEAVKPSFLESVQIILVLVVFWTVVHILAEVLLLLCNKTYRGMARITQIEYREYVVAMVHSTLVCYLSIYCTFFLCGEGKNFFTDQKCSTTVHNIQVWALQVAGGYLFVDLMCIFQVISLREGGATQLDKQSIIHHVLGFQTMWCALWPHNYIINFGVVMLFLEISTIFVGIRWLLFAHNLKGGSLYHNINTALVAITFIFGRFIYQLFACVVSALPWLWWTYFVQEGNSALYIALVVEMQVTVMINILMNMFWSWLIIKQVWRMITRGSEAGNQKFSEDLEKNGPQHVEMAEEDTTDKAFTDVNA